MTIKDSLAYDLAYAVETTLFIKNNNREKVIYYFSISIKFIHTKSPRCIIWIKRRFKYILGKSLEYFGEL